jgi:signal transduction histidine kinase
MLIQRHPIMTIVNISILAIILTYVQAMKVKCGYCTNIPETKYVTFLTSVILIQVLAVVIFPTQVRNFFMNNMWLILVLIVINIANIVFLYQFIQKMKVVQCNQCTSEWRRSFLYYYSSFVLILYAINIVLSIMAVLIMCTYYNPRSQIVTKSLVRKGRK